MRLKKLELIGFKSFMSRAQLEFDQGITAILGPNGCGKTNIVDSVRWVLGSQSPKALRGATMENVIFNGTRTRPPLGMAEVQLTLSNENGRLPTEFQEVAIARKVYRESPSEYLINQASCRLKDIKDLFLDTGVGTHGYSIIERDMIDAVLNDSLGQRRYFLDEAAGIMKYRQRREEAKRKLKLLHQDLLRLNDIVEEVDRQTRSLKYQMGKARRYQRLKERLDAMELHLAKERLLGILSHERARGDEVQKWESEAKRFESRAAELEAGLEESRASIHEVEEAYGAAYGRVESARSKLKEAESNLLVSRERIESLEGRKRRAEEEMEHAAARLKQIEEERAEIDATLEAKRLEWEGGERALGEEVERLGRLEGTFRERRERLLEAKRLTLAFLRDEAEDRGRLERLKASLQNLEEERDRLVAERDQVVRRFEAQLKDQIRAQQRAREAEETLARIEEELGDLEARLRAAEADLEREREREGELASELEGLSGKLDMLRRLEDERAGYGVGARWILGSGDGRILGTLAELLHVSDDRRAAVESVLEEAQGGVVVRDRTSAIELLDELGRQGTGRAHLFFPAGDSWTRLDTPKAKGILGTLADAVEGDEAALEAVRPLLSNVLLAEDFDAAVRFLESGDSALWQVVTPEGLFFRGGGLVTGGRSAERETDLLGRKDRLERMERDAGEVRWELGETEVRIRAREKVRGELEDSIAAVRERLAAAREARLEREVERARIEESIRERDQDHRRLEQAIVSLAARERELGGEIERLEREEHREREGEEALDLDEEERAIARLERDRDMLRNQVNDAKVRQASLRGELDNREERREALERMDVEFHRIHDERRREGEEAAAEIETLTAGLSAIRTESGELAAVEEVEVGKLEEIKDRLTREREGVEAREKEIKEIHAEGRAHRERQREAEVARARLSTESRSLVDRVRELHGEDWEPYLRGVPIEIDESVDWTQEELDETKQKLQSLGPVNLLALEEYEEKSERLAFLTRQRDDLVAAKESLERAIQKINRRAKERFLVTYEQVRKNFIEVFTTLFEGGEVDLTFVDSEDPLEADIQITASPRGKKLQHVSLLSTGESTLTALAYLFAIYMVKPSPFCLLDEIDAPLDDANIERFLKMIRRFNRETQFILITHNKLTMEAADHLYGVSMEEPGISRLVSVSFEEGFQLLEETPGEKKAETMVAS